MLDRAIVSSATGLGHSAASFTSADSFGSPRLLNFPRSRFTASSATGVCHIAAATCRGNWSILLRPSARVVVIPGESFQSRADAVTHSAISVGDEPQAITTVRPVDGTSRDNGRPPGVTDAFQVSKHSVEPCLANRRRNLLSHCDSGPSGTDEAKVVGPQVPIVSLGFAFAGDAERLARR